MIRLEPSLWPGSWEEGPQTEVVSSTASYKLQCQLWPEALCWQVVLSFLWTPYLRNAEGDVLNICHTCPLWGAKVKVIVTSRLSPSKECLNWISLHHKRPLGYKDELLRWLWPDKTLVSSMMNWWHFILKESKVSLLWTPNVLQKHFSGDYRQSPATARQ